MSRLKRFVRGVDGLNDWVGRHVAWLALAMVLVAAFVMVGRYGFGWGRVWLQESYVWMHGILFLLGAAYTLSHDGHVRVDVFYRDAKPRTKAMIDLCGTLFLLLPLLLVIVWTAFPYVMSSWDRFESSREAGGLPGLYLLKSVLLVFCALMILQAMAEIGRSILILRGHVDMIRSTEDPVP